MNTKKINSTFDHKVIEVLGALVPDQKMSLNDAEGNKWVSSCVNVNDAVAMITIKRNDDIVASIVYDYETGEEKSFIY